MSRDALKEFQHAVLRDPLNDITRKERRTLLGVSVLSIFIAESGLVPKEISAIGVVLESADQRAFLIVMVSIVIYFLFAFVLYGIADFLAWKIACNESNVAATKAGLDRLQNMTPKQNPYHVVAEAARTTWQNHFVYPVAAMRMLFEFVLPVIIGAVAIYSLLVAI